MPLREYFCTDCNYEFTYLEMHPEDQPHDCERCEGKHIERMISAFGGYSMNGTNGASTTPKTAGSKRRK